jgi:hypothetical protein
MVNTHGTGVRTARTSQAEGQSPAARLGRTDAAAAERQRLRTVRRPTAGGVLSPVRWNPVESSVLDAIAYKEGALYVRFKEGLSEYRFNNVPWHEYCKLSGAARARDGSVGRTFNLRVRPNYAGVRFAG